jgi:hypothetical protein
MSAIGEFEFREGDTIEQAMALNRTKAAPVALVERIFLELFDHVVSLNKGLSASGTKNRDRNHSIGELARVLGVSPGLPPLEDLGPWIDGTLYHPNDVARHLGQNWRCLTRHRADNTNTPGTDGDRNVWEELQAPKTPSADGSSVLERLAAVERALGIAAPKGTR